jgi:hypothetical protein
MENRRFPSDVLQRLRGLDARVVLPLVCEHAKRDSTFIPSKNPRSQRWHCYAGGGDFELLLTGPKWFDTRGRHGGGGAIDLVMALLRLPFVDAVRLLLSKGQ